MARGAAAPAAGPAPAGSPAPVEQPPSIPDKYLVKREDGSTDWEASALKQAQGYSALSQRMGAGEAPPKTPEEYAPDLPQGWDADRLKADPLFSGFLKNAHAKGLNNAQVSYVLAEFQNRMDMMRSPEVGAAELGKVWTTPEAMKQGLAQSYRGTQAFAVDADHAARLDAKFGNDPDFIRLMAKIGGELGEDKPPSAGNTAADANSLEDLKQHPAYRDSKHPEHRSVKARVEALYAKLYPNNT